VCRQSKRRNSFPAAHRQAGVQPTPGKQGSIACNSYLGRQMPSLQTSSPSFFFLQLYMPSMTPYCMEYPLGQLGSAVPAMSPPNFLCTWQHEKLQSPWLPGSNWKHHYVINIIFIPNPKSNSAPATRKKINSIPDKTRTQKSHLLLSWELVHMLTVNLSLILSCYELLPFLLTRALAMYCTYYNTVRFKKHI